MLQYCTFWRKNRKDFLVKQFTIGPRNGSDNFMRIRIRNTDYNKNNSWYIFIVTLEILFISLYFQLKLGTREEYLRGGNDEQDEKKKGKMRQKKKGREGQGWKI